MIRGTGKWGCLLLLVTYEMNELYWRVRKVKELEWGEWEVAWDWREMGKEREWVIVCGWSQSGVGKFFKNWTQAPPKFFNCKWNTQGLKCDFFLGCYNRCSRKRPSLNPQHARSNTRRCICNPFCSWMTMPEPMQYQSQSLPQTKTLTHTLDKRRVDHMLHWFPIFIID